MADSFEVTAERTVSPVEAFSLLGDELRVSILTALGDAVEGSQPRPLTFEELRDRCGVSDSGRFNYHLQKLVDVFVTETDEGYKLLYPGVKLYRAIKADSFTDRSTVDPFPVDGSCDECGGTLEAEYRHSFAYVTCRECDHLEFKYHLPPGAIQSGEVNAVVRAADAFARRDVMTVARDVCPTCGSEMFHDVVPEDDKESDLEHAIDGPAVVHHCSYCENFFCTRVRVPLLYRPEVTAFLAAREADVYTAPVWDLDLGDPAVTVTDEDPLRVTAHFGADGDRLDVVVDDELAVLDVQRPQTP